MANANGTDNTTEDLVTCTKGFDYVFNDDLVNARQIFGGGESAFHLLGLGVVSFLEAALGLEVERMKEAKPSLDRAKKAAESASKAVKYGAVPPKHRFRPGIEYEILQADATVLRALTEALSESYTGYANCLYLLNKAHGEFSKIFKDVYPNGLDAYSTPSISRTPSSKDIPSLAKPNSTSPRTPPPTSPSPSFFSIFTGSSTLKPPEPATPIIPNNPFEELILSGASFGFGLFNLVFSLLPATVKRLIQLFGYESDRRLALRALAVSAKGDDVHSHFAALTLMTINGIILLLTGYQADEEHVVRQYRAMLDKVQLRFPHGALWLLNRAKLARYTGNPSEAISILQGALASPDRHFVQADSLLVFELSWILFSERRYEESAEMFMKMTELNSWSHATYTFIAAGCYISLDKVQKAQELFDKLPDLLSKRKMGGKDLPTEIFIKQKIEFYKRKQKRWGGKVEKFADCIRVSPGEELAIFWNTHARLPKATAETHIVELLKFTPSVTVTTPYASIAPATPSSSSSSSAPSSAAPFKSSSPAQTSTDLDTKDEVLIRNFLLGILHRSAGLWSTSRQFLLPIGKRSADTVGIEANWAIPLASFELAVLAVKEADDQAQTITKEGSTSDKTRLQTMWTAALNTADGHLKEASSNLKGTIMESRLQSRIALLHDELDSRRLMLDL